MTKLRFTRPTRNLLMLLIAICTFVLPHLSIVISQIAKAQEENPSVKAADLDAAFATEWMQMLYGRVEAEKISPPAASRVYAYAGVTLYEAVLAGMPGFNSLAGQLTDMPDMPELPDEKAIYDWPASADAALAVTLKGLMSADSVSAIDALRTTHLAGRTQATNAEVVKRSVDYGESIGKAILDWAAKDGYKEAESKPYELPKGDASTYILTTPGTKPNEPYWGTLRTFALQSTNLCDVQPSMKFDTDPSSTFYAQAMEVKTTRDNLTEEQKAIANFWVDTAGITGTPGGHWVSIENQVVIQQHIKLDWAAGMYALVGVALGDAFIACWNLKYEVLLLRPETYIKQYIRRSWAPYIQTPPFPEYPSGHSVASAAAAEVLTKHLGTVAFKDDTHKIHNMPARFFTSFEAAAQEAAISRLYGGIHYRAAIENGLRQGHCIGSIVLSRIQLKPRLNG
ncbi:MAG: vanadium-dependent haloperoxidase [Chloroflexota bacterium]